MNKYYVTNGTFHTVPERSDELCHYGVKGMKWGVRKASPEVATARKAYKQAKRDFNRAYNKADFRRAAALSPIKKHRQANDARWDDAMNKAHAMKDAKRAYKQAKKADKQRRAEGYESKRTKRLKEELSDIDADTKDLQRYSKDGLKNKKGKTIWSADDVKSMLDTNEKWRKETEVKLLKSQYRDKINAGASAVGRAYNKLTGADKYEADIWYDEKHRG